MQKLITNIKFFDKLLNEERMEKFQFNFLMKNLDYEFMPAEQVVFNYG